MRHYDTSILSKPISIINDDPLVENSLRAELGKTMRRRRLELDISQERCAEVARLHRTYYAGVERGERNPTFDNLVRIAYALQLTPSELMAGIEWQPPRDAVTTATKTMSRPRIKSRGKAPPS